MGAVQWGFCSIHPARAMDAPGGGLWRGLGRIASRRDEFTKVLHGPRQVSSASPALYLPLIRRN
ncbi:MAG: hypothetical protein CR217_04055 [Beijerinckiaceae bacterium]|nr:MAG: hypothetical protein CR217_04055 [Beijerinckiaceae bacterium]